MLVMVPGFQVSIPAHKFRLFWEWGNYATFHQSKSFAKSNAFVYCPIFRSLQFVQVSQLKAYATCVMRPGIKDCGTSVTLRALEPSTFAAKIAGCKVQHNRFKFTSVWIMQAFRNDAILSRIADHKINRIDELLPWNYLADE